MDEVNKVEDRSGYVVQKSLIQKSSTSVDDGSGLNIIVKKQASVSNRQADGFISPDHNVVEEHEVAITDKNSGIKAKFRKLTSFFNRSGP